MERKRNRPERYNRDLVHKTVKAVEKVSAVSPPWLPSDNAAASCAACWSFTACSQPADNSEVVQIRERKGSALPQGSHGCGQAAVAAGRQADAGDPGLPCHGRTTLRLLPTACSMPGSTLHRHIAAQLASQRSELTSCPRHWLQALRMLSATLLIPHCVHCNGCLNASRRQPGCRCTWSRRRRVCSSRRTRPGNGCACLWSRQHPRQSAWQSSRVCQDMALERRFGRSAGCVRATSVCACLWSGQQPRHLHVAREEVRQSRRGACWQSRDKARSHMQALAPEEKGRFLARS